MASTYNPYSDINEIYNLKGQWDEANKAGNTAKTNQIAATAQAYYDKLKNNGYSGVAQVLSASGYQDAKAIRDNFAPTTNTELTTKNNNEVNSKINQLWGIQNSDHTDLTNMYKQEYNDIKNTNPFTTAEAKAILGKYSLAGLQARDNAVASGSASNGGNIDSYAAANAIRQQASLINQGQMAVLDAHQQKIDNARSILEGLGAYQHNNYSSMQNTIGLQQNDGQRLFENEETAKNNEVARKSEIASVTGYAPDEWVVSNNPYMNEDGTIKDKYKDVDFSAVMANAKAVGNTEAYNAAAVARYYKIMSNYGAYGQYDDGNYILPGAQRTADYDLTQQQIDSAEKIAFGGYDNNVDVAKVGVGNNADNKELTKANADATISSWLYSLENIDRTGYFKEDWTDSTNTIYAARDKLNDPDTYTYLKNALILSGYTNSEANKKIDEWKVNIAKKAATAEGKDKVDADAYKDIMKKWGWA